MCRVDYDWDEESVMLQAPHEVKARKEHTCSNCQREIDRGEKYWTGTWIYDGSMNTTKYCAHCIAAGEWLKGVCGGFLWGDNQILEELAEHYDEETQFQCEPLQLLIVAMRSRWLDTSVSRVEDLTAAALVHAKAQLAGAHG